MANIEKRNSFALPADFGDRLMAGIADTRSSMTVSSDGGKDLLRLLRNGTWVYGSNNEPVAEGSQWAINLATASRGWVCWFDGQLLGQVMASIQAPRPSIPDPIDGHPFAEQYAFELTCIAGDNAGDMVLYKNNSYGFKTAFDKLMSDIQQQWQADKQYYWPIVELFEESYDHKKYGQIFNPILEIVAWADADGNIKGGAPAQAAPAPAPAPAPEAPKPRQRRAPVASAPAPAGLPKEEPVSTQQAHAGQRRRPAR